MKKILGITLLLTYTALPSMAKDIGAVTGFEIPRFVSTKSIPVNVRTGPGKRYPVKVIYKVKLPVQIIDEYGNWRKIRDWQGEQGWIHRLLLSAKRLGMITSINTALYSRNNDNSSLNAKLSSDIVVAIDYCKIKWCKVSVPLTDFSGYIKNDTFWGLGKSETIN